MFRRRRREDADQASSGHSGADAVGDTEGSWEDPNETGEWDDGAAGQAGAVPSGAVSPSPVPPGLRGGPWDANQAYPERDRADFGSILVPVTPMQQIELATDGQRFIWVTVKSGLSELRVHAFAAPRSGGLWADVRQEIARRAFLSQYRTRQDAKPFREAGVFAHVAVEPGNASTGTLPVRFIGIDGPRWLLRGLIIGDAATGAEPVEPFEELLSDIVVVRGDHPMPPRDMLELRLPPEVQQALEQQQALAQQQAGGEEPEEENRSGPTSTPSSAVQSSPRRAEEHRSGKRPGRP